MSEFPSSQSNQQIATGRLKAASYLFALICTGFLTFSCVSYDRRGETVPVTVWMPCLLLIGGALGLNIDLAEVAGLMITKRD